MTSQLDKNKKQHPFKTILVRRKSAFVPSVSLVVEYAQVVIAKIGHVSFHVRTTHAQT